MAVQPSDEGTSAAALPTIEQRYFQSVVETSEDLAATAERFAMLQADLINQKRAADETADRVLGQLSHEDKIRESKKIKVAKRAAPLPPREPKPLSRIETPEDLTFFLRTQYEWRAWGLVRRNLLSIEDDVDIVMYDINGGRHILPKSPDLIEAVLDRYEEVATKINQGMNLVQIVPRGRRLIDLIFRHRLALEQASAAGQLKDGLKRFKINPAEPLAVPEHIFDADVNEELVYRVMNFGPHHEGYTKSQMLEAGLPGAGIDVVLMENPFAFTSDTVVNGRAVPPRDQTPRQYLRMTNHLDYRGEEGMTPEDWHIQALWALDKYGMPLDNIYTTGYMNSLVGSFMPNLGEVPAAYFWSPNNQAVLFGTGPDFDVKQTTHHDSVGARFTYRLASA